MTCASEYCTMQITFTHLPTTIYYALTPTSPLNKFMSNAHKSDNKHRFLLIQNVGYSIAENVWTSGEFQASPQIADHNMFKLGHFPIVHFKTSNYYSFPYQKVSTFKAWGAVVVSIVQNAILKWRCEPTMKIPMGGPLPGVSQFGGPPVKIFTTQKQHALKLQPLYIVFIGYLSTITAHKPLEFVVLTHTNLYLSLGGPLPDLVQ